MPVSKKEISPRPVDAARSVIDGRWKATILWRLCDGPMRTSELRRSIPEMTESGILERHDRKTIPPCVRYSISPYGLTLVPLVDTLCAWGRIHLARPKTSSPFASVPPAKTTAAHTRPSQAS